MYNTEGIILKKTDAGEADAFITLYTKDFGKIRALAQGVKKEGAKLRGHLEPLNFASVGFVIGKNGERLTHASLINPWRHIRTDFEKLETAWRMLSYIDECCFPGEREEQLWQTLLASLLSLDGAERVEDDFLRSFEMAVEKCLGYTGEDVR